MNMDNLKVVSEGYKLDLHIHSIYSRKKDSDRVKYNTIERLPILVEKLTFNSVNICAITDHDVFNYDIYKKFKTFEKDSKNSIIKVFPGIEFSVAFDGVVVHVITIFDDQDDEKIKKISTSLMNGSEGDPIYDYEDKAFTEEKFLSILREIDIDTILIVHQKNTLTSKRVRQSDAMSVGMDHFNDFITTEFFEAFEFRNKRNEVFNKSYLYSKGISEDVRFITGSDCHDWQYYPKEDAKDQSEFIYTYVKCLPTFRGLVMAITDYRRIKRVNSFFNPTEKWMPSIEMHINGNPVSVPLSRGINVIIGDNSIGKSLLLHKITKYCKKDVRLLKSAVAKSYEQYLRNNHIKVDSCLAKESIFVFDMQGEVRKKFEEEKIRSDDFFSGYYPEPVDPAPYREMIEREIGKVFDYLQEKFIIEEMEKNLGGFKLICNEEISVESLSFMGMVYKSKNKIQCYSDICSQLLTVIEKIKSIKSNKLLENEDGIVLDKIISSLQALDLKYEKKNRKEMTENKKIEVFTETIQKYKEKYNAVISDEQKQNSQYNKDCDDAINHIIDLVLKKQKNRKPVISLSRQDIMIRTNKVFEYEFNSKLSISSIDNSYIKGLFKRSLKKDVTTDICDMTKEKLAKSLSYYDGTEEGSLDELKKVIHEKIEEDLKGKYTIIQAGMDKTQELSSGFNAKIYFDLLSYEDAHNGVYIIDQPEDNISQKAIREYLLERFKVMGEHRQVIIVTHNPQFIVNLDVDNVIFLGKIDDQFLIESGALEYKNTEYSMLDIISTQIEGGIDTLKRRLKRYEKNS
jgi:predicted ATPase